MFWSKERKHVPKARGPYVPGCCDFMSGYGKDALFIRFYYPSSAENIDSESERWPTWLPDDGYIVGLAKLLWLWPFIIRAILWLRAGTFYVPAVYGAKVTEKLEKLGCIVFSPGMIVTHFLYTSICIELASYGFVVCAVEHRDGTPWTTYCYEDEESVRRDKKTFLEHEKFSSGGSPYSSQKMLARSEEAKRVLDLLCALNSGDPAVQNILKDLPGSDQIEFDLSQFKGRLDTESVTMMGHSFGGAAALFTLKNEPRFKQGVLLDTFMYPVKDEKLAENISQPLIFVGTHTFQTPSNARALKQFLEQKTNTSMYIILNTSHESQCDIPFILGQGMNPFLKKLEPGYAIRITCSLIFDFLHKNTSKPEDITINKKFLTTNEHHYYDGFTRPWASRYFFL